MWTTSNNGQHAAFASQGREARNVRNPKDCSHAWLQVFKETTSCLRGGSSEDLDHCLIYLKELEKLLRSSKNLRGFQTKNPPAYRAVNVEESSSQQNLPRDIEIEGKDGRFRTANQFGAFQDDCSDSHSEDDDSSDFSIDTEAGDSPMLNREDEAKDRHAEPRMDRRRLLIRVINGQSDVYAAKASVCRKQSPPQWTLGAEQYKQCLDRIHVALTLADSGICRWLKRGEKKTEAPIMQLLLEDASIVEVAIQSMTKNREGFLVAAQKQEAYLLYKLEPKWQSRDEIKKKMGDRWFSNPSPKHNHSTIRAAQEEQLADVRKALLCLEETDTTTLALLSEEVKKKLLPLEKKKEKQRYNGVRPQETHTGVDLAYYPDPTTFGWTFTGSSGAAIFFEKENVKLDWYFSTATMKTALDHPVQGKTQLFGAQVSPETYRAILLDPRSHTGNRYQTKRNKK